jgi:hypothetical protein
VSATRDEDIDIHLSSESCQALFVPWRDDLLTAENADPQARRMGEGDAEGIVRVLSGHGRRMREINMSY